MAVFTVYLQGLAGNTIKAPKEIFY